MPDSSTTSRETALAALAGTAVDRLFVGGPLDGEVHTMAPDDMYLVVGDPDTQVNITTFGSSSRTIIPAYYRYRARLFGHGKIGGRYIMVGENVGAVDHAVYQCLLRRWLAEAPERTP